MYAHRAVYEIKNIHHTEMSLIMKVLLF